MKFTLLIFLIHLLTSFCASAKTSEKPLTTIDVQLKWRHQFQFAGYYAAIAQGYYQEAGLEVNLLERLPGPTPIDRLIIGNVDYAIGSVGALAYRINGAPLVALAATFQHTPSVLISRFGNVMSLKNKKIMLSKGIMNAEITTLLQQHGLTPSDYHTVPSDQSIEGFINGEYDAYNGYVANEVYQLNERNIPHYIFSPRNDQDAFYGDILLTTEKRINTKEEEVKNFRTATLKGWEYAITHINEMIKLIQLKYNSQNKTTKQLNVEAQELIKLMHADIVPIGYMNEQRWLGIANSLQRSGNLTEERINLDGFIYSHYTHQSFFDFVKNNLKSIFISILFFIAPMLLIYNRRLKVKVRERTNQLNLARQQAEQDARTDPLTGIANRRFFMEAFAHNLAISRRNNLALSLIYIDIDWFKNVNDTYGHTAGDEALKILAKILTNSVRASDTPARIGGEEFSIICLEKNQKNAINLAERIRREVEKTVFNYQNDKFKITLSLGVTSVDAKDTLESVLNKCDSALYKAKELGRNQVQWI